MTTRTMYKLTHSESDCACTYQDFYGEACFVGGVQTSYHWSLKSVMKKIIEDGRLDWWFQNNECDCDSYGLDDDDWGITGQRFDDDGWDMFKTFEEFWEYYEDEIEHNIVDYRIKKVTVKVPKKLKLVKKLVRHF